MADLREPERLQDDGLALAEVGAWAEDKHRLVALYAQMFARAMKGKWQTLTYLDLFAGPGRCRMRDSGVIQLTSPTLVLSSSADFDRYVFCEQDPGAADALARRARRDFPGRPVEVRVGDANSLAAGIAAAIPERSSLSFCFLDPYRMANLRFQTVESLASRRMDFLVLIPSGMDSNRNVRTYAKAGHTLVEAFCGAADWRNRWDDDLKRGHTFETFIVEEFGRSMTRLGYRSGGLERAHPIRSDDKNQLLYRLAFYSKSELGDKFWREAQKYSTPQRSLGF